VFKHLELSFGEASHAAAEIPDADSSAVQAWRTSDGALVALGHTTNGTHWMHWPGLASFSFGAGDGRVTAYPSRAVGRRIVRDIYQRSVLPVALQALGAEALHASAVHTRRGVVGFFASSETGKSTLAFELAKRGHAQWSDDSIVFDSTCPDATVVRLPFRVRVPGASSTSRPPTSTLPHRAPVAALFLLERAQLAGRGPVCVEPLAGGEAFSALLTHAHCFEAHRPERRSQMIHFFLNVAARVPTLRLRFRPCLRELPSVMNAVEHAVATLENSASLQLQNA
jgi:hypothetical protein